MSTPSTSVQNILDFRQSTAAVGEGANKLCISITVEPRDFRPPQTVCHAYSRLPAGFSESEVSVCSWAYATCSCLEASHFSTTREVWLERLAWASLSGKYVHISFHAILNSDSKMPASTGQYGSQCGSITMRYSIIHSQCWLSIATYKYLRTRQ